LAALAFALTLPAAWLGFAADDHIFRYAVPRVESALRLFDFPIVTDPSSVSAGLRSWWSNPALSIKFWRPLSSLTHFIDYRFWPDAAWWMHVESGLIYVGCVFAAAQVYRALLPDLATAGLAGLLFAVDDAHASAVGWLSSRNTVLAAMFALLAVWAHVHARREHSHIAHALSTLAAAAALGSGESGVACYAYLFAYAWVFESGPRWLRWRTLVPQLAVSLVWAAGYCAYHFGLHGAGWYRDPSQPLSLLWQGALDLPLWCLSLLGLSSVSLAAFTLSPLWSRTGALLFAVPLLLALWPSMRASKALRFFALGSLLSLPSLFTTVPQERLLVIASLGAFAVLAHFILTVTRTASLPEKFVWGVVCVCHLAISPLAFIPMLDVFGVAEQSARRLARAIPASPQHSAILLNTPFELLPMYAAMFYRTSHRDQHTQPGALRILYAGQAELSARRSDERTLELEVAPGWGAHESERVWADRRHMPVRGERRVVGDLEVLVLDTNAEGLPSRVQFRFDSPLDAPTRHWFVWQGADAVPWQLPQVGQRVSLPVASVWRTLVRR
jgi:hypothetical protein